MSIRKAISKLSSDLARNRGLKGNRNQNGDFITADEMMKDVNMETTYTPVERADGSSYSLIGFENFNAEDFKKTLLSDPDAAEDITNDLLKAYEVLKQDEKLDELGIKQQGPADKEQLENIENALQVAISARGEEGRWLEALMEDIEGRAAEDVDAVRRGEIELEDLNPRIDYDDIDT